MPIRAVCPECQQVYKVADEKAGKRFQCKQCSGVVTIPAVAGAAVVPQAAAPVKKPVKKPMAAVAAPVAVEVEEPAVASPAKKKKKKTAPTSGKSSFGLSTLIKTYQRAFDVQGRSNRTEYFNFLLSVFLVQVASVVMSIATDDGIPNEPNTAQFSIMILMGIYGLATFIPSFTVTIRRFHDFDKSGWWLLINLIPILGPLLQLIMMFRAGTPGKNRFGPQPA